MHPSRTSFVTTALLAVLLPAALAPVSAADGVRLRYRLDPKAHYEQKMAMTTTMHVEIEGLPAEQASVLGAFLGQDMTQEVEMTLSLDTGEKASDGSTPFEIGLGSVEGSMTVGGNKIPLPQLEEPVRMKGRLAPDGRALELDTAGIDALEQVVPTDVVNTLMKMTPPFPEGKLAIGESLTVPQSYEMPVPGMPGEELRIEGATVFTLRAVEADAASFDVESNVAVSAGGEAGAGLDLTLGGGGRGTAIFDPRRGMFSRISIDMDIRMQMNLPAEAAQAEGAGTGPLKMNMTMKGPVEITMAKVEP